MSAWLQVIGCVAVLGLHGCGGGSNGSSGEPNLRRCQATCTSLCARPLLCSPCSVDECQNLCLGTTDGLTAPCAECVVTNPDYTGSIGSGCTVVFKSTASAECLPVCGGAGADAAAN